MIHPIHPVTGTTEGIWHTQEETSIESTLETWWAKANAKCCRHWEGGILISSSWVSSVALPAVRQLCHVPSGHGSTYLRSHVWLWSSHQRCRGETNASAFVCGCLLTGAFAWCSHTPCSNTSRWTFSSHPLSLQIAWWLSLQWSMVQQGHTSQSSGSSHTYHWSPTEYGPLYWDI